MKSGLMSHDIQPSPRLRNQTTNMGEIERYREGERERRREREQGREILGGRERVRERV